jgi:hypothetical protein
MKTTASQAKPLGLRLQIALQPHGRGRIGYRRPPYWMPCQVGHARSYIGHERLYLERATPCCDRGPRESRSPQSESPASPRNCSRVKPRKYIAVRPSRCHRDAAGNLARSQPRGFAWDDLPSTPSVEYTGNHQNTPEYIGIHRNIPEYTGSCCWLCRAEPCRSVPALHGRAAPRLLSFALCKRGVAISRSEPAHPSPSDEKTSAVRRHQPPVVRPRAAMRLCAAADTCAACAARRTAFAALARPPLTPGPAASCGSLPRSAAHMWCCCSPITEPGRRMRSEPIASRALNPCDRTWYHAMSMI